MILTPNQLNGRHITFWYGFRAGIVMKKIIFSSAILLLLAIPGFSQALKPVKIDSLVTVSMPDGYSKKDTLGQQIFSGNGTLGFMVVLRAPNAKDKEPLQKEKDLNKVLKNEVKSIQKESSYASAQYVRDTTIGALKAKTFTLQTDAGQGDIQLRNITILYTTDATYTFEYTYPDARKGVIKSEYSAFINSIKLSPALQRDDQYLTNAKGMSTIAAIALYGGGGLLIIAAFFVIIKRRNMQLG